MEALAEILSRTAGTAGISTLPDFEAYERKRAEWENSVPGNLPGDDCPLCLNRGYIRERRDGQTVSVPCKCMARRRTMRRVRESGLEDMLAKYTFAAYEAPYEWQKKAKQMALDYVRDHEGKWFLAAGAVGSGKSHLCTAICGALMDAGVEVRYMLWRDESVRLKAAVNDEAEYARLIEPLKRVKVLYIDDFLKAGQDEKTRKPKITPGDVNIAFELVNSRYNRKDLVTVLSTELTVAQIMDIDAGLGSRIYERSKGYRLQIEGNDKNWRLRG